MSRRFPWKHKPSSDDVRLIQRCIAPDPTAPTLFLLSEVGATQFILQSSSAPTSPSPLPSLSSPPPSVTKHRVMIGDTQRCTCGDAKEGHRLCCHLLFVMLKVMRVKESDPLVWQLALTETEVTAVVKGRWEWKEEGRRRRKRGRVEEKGREQGSAQAGQVQRKAVEADDVCVVCQEEMRGEDGGVVLGLCWCDAGCGSALHARCMRVWAEHQSAQTGSAITCPVSRRDSTRKHTSLYLLTVNSPTPLCVELQMCRSDWSKSDDFTLLDLLQQLKQQEDPDTHVTAPAHVEPTPCLTAKRRERKRTPCAEPSRRCRGCRMSIAGHHPLYRCVHCSHQLCRACFSHHSTQPRHSSSDAGHGGDGHPHTFVLRCASSVAMSGWCVPTLGAASSPSHLLQQLQSRELTTADYDLLLQLDQRQRGQPLYAYLAASLPPYRSSRISSPLPSISSPSLDSMESPSDGPVCAFCSHPLCSSSSPGAAAADGRLLPCAHVAHHHCLSSSAMYDTVGLHCPLCQQPAFPGLHSFHQPRTPRKARQVAAVVEEEPIIPVDLQHSQLHLGVSGQHCGEARPHTLVLEEGKEQLSEAGARPARSAPPQQARSRQSRLGQHARFERPSPSSTLPSLPAIHLLSLSSALRAMPLPALAPHMDALPPARALHQHGRSTSIPALPAVASSAALLPSTGSLRVNGARPVQTAPLPANAPASVRGRLHRGLTALHRSGSEHGKVEDVGGEVHGRASMR